MVPFVPERSQNPISVIARSSIYFIGRHGHDVVVNVRSVVLFVIINDPLRLIIAVMIRYTNKWCTMAARTGIAIALGALGLHLGV